MASFRNVGFVWGALLLLALANCEAGAPISGFIQARNAQFVQNGSPFLFNGFNSYWMMHIAAQPSQRYKISNVFREAEAGGLTVCRTWAFSDGGDQALQISPGVYSETVFQVFLFPISLMFSSYTLQDPACMCIKLLHCDAKLTVYRNLSGP